MAEQTDAHDFVQSRNKAMNFDREKKQKQINGKPKHLTQIKCLGKVVV